MEDIDDLFDAFAGFHADKSGVTNVTDLCVLVGQDERAEPDIFDEPALGVYDVERIERFLSATGALDELKRVARRHLWSECHVFRGHVAPSRPFRISEQRLRGLELCRSGRLDDSPGDLGRKLAQEVSLVVRCHAFEEGQHLVMRKAMNQTLLMIGRKIRKNLRGVLPAEKTKDRNVVLVRNVNQYLRDISRMKRAEDPLQLRPFLLLNILFDQRLKLRTYHETVSPKTRGAPRRPEFSSLYAGQTGIRPLILIRLPAGAWPSIDQRPTPSVHPSSP